MSSAFEVISSVFILLPGFLIVGVNRSTREHRELSNFEFTITSLAYSVIVFGGFLVLGSLVEMFSKGAYVFFGRLREILSLDSGHVSLLFSGEALSGFCLYVGSFISILLLSYSVAWASYIKRIARSLGFDRFTEYLTPWEDFMRANSLNWIAAELDDGRTVLGRIGAFSHFPFDRQLILSSTKTHAMQIYDAEKKLIELGEGIRIEQFLVHQDKVKTLQAVVDNQIEGIAPKTKNFIILSIFLVFSIAAVCTTFGFLASMIANKAWSWTISIPAAMAVALPPINLKYLSKKFP